MPKTPLTKALTLLLALLAFWIGIRYALPVAVPFLFGGLLALAAEPMTGLLTGKLHAPRWLASGVAVTLVFLLLIGTLLALLAILAKQAGRLTTILPDLTAAASSGLGSLEGWLLRLASHAPGQLQPILTGGVTSLFTGSSQMMESVVSRALSVVSRLLTALTDGALGFATGILSAYMISFRLPNIRAAIRHRLPQAWHDRYLPALKGLKKGLLGYILAQLKLSGIALLLLLVCFWLLKIPYAPVWAAAISLVDAFPVLGCGTVLLPWSLICLLQGQQARSIGLLGTYALVWLSRSVLEPKLLGKELGLDPLTTLIAVYAGLKLFGFLGMLLAPMLAMTVVRLVKSYPKAN